MFQSADSSLVLTAATDDHGTVGAVLAAGGYVTVIEPDDGTGVTRLATVAATMPGDALHLDLAPLGATDASELTVTVPTAPGAAGYQIDTSCGQLLAAASATTTGQLIGCDGAADMLVMAIDQSSAILGSLYVADVSISDQPAILSGSYSALVATAFAYSGVPSATNLVTTFQAIVTARGSLFDATTTGAVAAGGATSALDMPAAMGALALTVSSPQPGASEHGEQRVFDWGPPSSPYTLDFASAMLPAYATAPSYDSTTRTVSWTERDGGVAPDVIRARIHMFRDAFPDGRAWSWEIVAPRGAVPSVAYPRFAGSGFDYNPGATDITGVDDLVTISVPGGYEAVRAHGFDDVQTFVAGSSGRLVAETLYSPPL
jgi:hypothetical protein